MLGAGDGVRQHETEARIARIFNTFGPRMRSNDGRVIPAFVSSQAGRPLTVFGDGSDAQLLLRERPH